MKSIKCHYKYVMMITRSIDELILWGLMGDRIVCNEAQTDKVRNKKLSLSSCLVTYYLIY